MPSFTEGKYPGEYIASEGNGEISRDLVTLAQQGTVTSAATVLGVITATGKATPLNLTANDGSQNAKLILFGNVDATAADTQATVTARQTEVNGAELVYPAGANAGQIAAINTQLAAQGIIVRAGSV